MVTFEQVYHLAEQLPLSEQLRLMPQLRQKVSYSSGSVTREQLLAEFERKKQAGVFENAESLYGKYANPNANVSQEDLQATIREIRDQWKEDFPELNDDR
jgi:hypothetical protein